MLGTHIPGIPGRAAWAAGAVVLTATVLAAARWEQPLLLLVPAALAAIPVLGLRLISRPAGVIALFLFLSPNLDFFRLGDDGLSLHVALSAVFLYALIVRLIIARATPFRTPVERFFLVFLAVTLVSVVLSVNPAASFANWFRDVEYLILYALIMILALEVRDRRLLIGAVLLSSIVPCLTALAGALFGISEFSWLESPLGGGELVRRVSGVFPHPVSLSLYLAVTATLTLSFIIDRSWFRRSYLIPLFLLQLATLYLTFGRTGWIAFFVSLVVLLYMAGHRRWLFVGLPVFLTGAALSLPTFVARWQSALQLEGDNSFLWRLGLWAYTLTLIPQRPFFGAGQDTFADYVAYGEGKGSHQTWLGITLETGFVGLAAFLALVVTIVVLLRRRTRLRDRPLTAADRGTVAVFVGILAASLAENPFEVPVIATLVWVLLALTMSERSRRLPGS